eukprot:CAMPEP_0170592146 /NCGR_PEP_ID=MMETSP0224-20130122/12775_1 /TAXON_ID=285029 /ORGANISM="Togula jolla, Strain CCCM 725" /LENGTH=543 /DNA_ID=CAMNT_0010916045 /DNA_START=97 /DNA_END=1728 /DNA_ORIENTATION=-
MAAIKATEEICSKAVIMKKFDGDNIRKALLMAQKQRMLSQLKSNRPTFSALNIDGAPTSMPVSLVPLSKSTQALVRNRMRQVSEPVVASVQPSSWLRQRSAPDARASAGSSQTLSGTPLQRIPEPVAVQSAPPAELPTLKEEEVHPSIEDESPMEETSSAVNVDRDLLLRFRCVVDEFCPSELEGLVATVEASREPVKRCNSKASAAESATTATTASAGGSPRRGRRYSSSSSASDLTFSASQSELNWTRPAEPQSRTEALKRRIQSLLNKVCPENVATIVEKMGDMEVSDADDLEVMIQLIFKKAITEPHYCETYADLVFSLKSVFPEFPSEDGRKPITFRSSVLNICQAEFEKVLKPSSEEKVDHQDEEEVAFLNKIRKDTMLANMKFIGHLFLRHLLSAKVIGAVIRELVLADSPEAHPEEHAIECVCELLTSVGYTLEGLPLGSQNLIQVCGRLVELKNAKTAAGKGVYCRRVQFLIQDLLDTRSAGWTKKVFKSMAKTKEEIRLEQEREFASRSRGQSATGAEHVLAGERPAFLAKAA